MFLHPDVVDALIATGATAVMIAAAYRAAHALEQNAESAAMAKAEADAERKRAAKRPGNNRRQQRKRHLDQIEMFEPSTEADFADAAIAESQPVTPVTVTPHKKKESISVKESDSDSKKKYMSATLCSPNWQPTEAHHAIAAAKGLNREKVEQLAGEMRAWSEANRHRDCAYKADWDAAFSGWIARQKPVLTVVEGGRPVIKPQREMTAEEFAREMQIASERGKAHRKILFGG